MQRRVAGCSEVMHRVGQVHGGEARGGEGGAMIGGAMIGERWLAPGCSQALVSLLRHVTSYHSFWVLSAISATPATPSCSSRP